MTWTQRPQKPPFADPPAYRDDVEIFQASLTLTDAQIKGLPNAPLQIVPTPGVGYVLVPIVATFVKSFDAGAYTNETGFCAMYIVDGTGDQATNLVKAPEATAADHKIHSVNGRSNIPDQEGSFAGFLVSSNHAPNSALLLAAATDDGLDFGGGNAANTLKVTLLYTVVAL